MPFIRNDTIYRNQIHEGITTTAEINRLVRRDAHNMTLWQNEHPLITRDQSRRQKYFENMVQHHRAQFDTANDTKMLEDIAEITIKPVQICKLTNKYEPIQIPGINIGEGLGEVVNNVADLGSKILDKGPDVATTVIDTGLNFLSEPIKTIVIVASVIAGTILLIIASKYLKNYLPRQDAGVRSQKTP